MGSELRHRRLAQARLKSMRSGLIGQPSLLTASSYIPGRTASIQPSASLGRGASIMRGISKLTGQESAITMEDLEDLPEEPEEYQPVLPQGLVGQPSMLQQQGSMSMADEAYTFRILTAAAADLQRHADQQDPRV